MGESFLQGRILFEMVSPESLLHSLLERGVDGRTPRSSVRLGLDAKDVTEEAYLHVSKMYPGNARRTVDEQLQRYHELKAILASASSGGIFQLLADYGKRVLNLIDADPKVKQEKILEWREVSLALGQDLFTCASLAEKDLRDRTQHYSFGWPAAVQTDNIPLRQLLEAGCAENHYHLNGSTQIFALTWCYLMNHPAKLTKYFASKEMRDGLTIRRGTSSKDNRSNWPDKMCLAAWIRARLFCEISNLHCPEDAPLTLREYVRQPDRKFQLYALVQQCRMYAAKLRQGRKSCRLDYAITGDVAASNPGPTRLLTGERSLLYHCFYRCYAGSFSSEQMNLLYLYLLIKREFRSELVQTNGRRGFWNFADYQDRKALVWGETPEYWRESYILSLAENLSGSRGGKPVVQTLEARIAPMKTAAALLATVRDIDSAVEEYRDWQTGHLWQHEILPRAERYWKNAQEHAQYFYVLHFIKKPLPRIPEKERERTQWLPARNHEVRKIAEAQAKALARGLTRSSYLCSRIRGIDASSREIGCRPETFATQFRYLRNNLVAEPQPASNLRYWPKLRSTYHVGEDFLDLTDGLRAIDEAITFLDLEPGDRLGHALALGISPRQYYRVKDHASWLPAQDLLDNLVWLMFRSMEWDVPIPSSLRELLRDRAQQLLDQIYPNKDEGANAITLRDYYDAWRLRGDDPELYWQALSDEVNIIRVLTGSSKLLDHHPYKRAMLHKQKNDGGIDTHASLRRSPRIRQVLIRYHFGAKERVAGQEPVCFAATPDFIAVLEKMQQRMMEKIMGKGIAVECNPSSNHLIGTFDRYEEHPIFRFNHFGLQLPEYGESSAQLRVSVNTDDLGVFDTSLENEYALLFGALCGRRNAEGRPLLCHDEILAYMEHLRVMGNSMAFPKAEKTYWQERV